MNSEDIFVREYINESLPHSDYEHRERHIKVYNYIKMHGRSLTGDIYEGLKDDNLSWVRISASARFLVKLKLLTEEVVGKRTFYDIAKNGIGRIKYLKDNLKENIDDIIDKVNGELRTNDINYDTDKFKKNRNILIQYLQHIAYIYTDIHSMKKRYTDLATKRAALLEEDFDEYEKARHLLEAEIVQEKKELDELNNYISNKPVYYLCVRLPKPHMPTKPEFNLEKPLEPTYLTPSLFNKKKIQVKNEELKTQYLSKLKQFEEEERQHQEETKNYEKLLKQYEKDLEECKNKEEELSKKEFEKRLQEYETQVDKYVSDRDEKQKRIENMENSINSEIDNKLAKSTVHTNRMAIEYEMDYIVQNIKKAIDIQNRLYSYGIVYGKYRDFIAISSFCDYLISGRCASLEGSEGAYNLYEQETRADIVIDKLDKIVSSLNNNSKKKYFIYEQLKNVNASLESINNQLLVNNMLQIVQIDQLDDIVANTKQTAYNTVVTAYYAEKTAHYTEALAFIELLN